MDRDGRTELARLAPSASTPKTDATIARNGISSTAPRNSAPAAWMKVALSHHRSRLADTMSRSSGHRPERQNNGAFVYRTSPKTAARSHRELNATTKTGAPGRNDGTSESTISPAAV